MDIIDVFAIIMIGAIAFDGVWHSDPEDRRKLRVENWNAARRKQGKK